MLKHKSDMTRQFGSYNNGLVSQTANIKTTSTQWTDLACNQALAASGSVHFNFGLDQGMIGGLRFYLSEETQDTRI